MNFFELEAIYWATSTSSWYPRAIHSKIRQIDFSFVVCLSSSLVCAFEKLRRSLSKSGPVQYGKIIFFWAKIASALKRQFLTTPNIKYGTNCRARLFTKFSCEVLFCFAYLDKPFLRTNNINFVLLTVFLNFFCFTYFDATGAMSWNMKPFISAQRKIPTSSPRYLYPDWLK